MSEVEAVGDGGDGDASRSGASGVISSHAVVPAAGVGSAGGGGGAAATPAGDGLWRSRSYHAPLEQRHTGHSHNCPTDF